MSEGLLKSDASTHTNDVGAGLLYDGQHGADADEGTRLRDRLTETHLAEQQRYWLDQLDNLPGLRLPADRPGPAVPGTARAAAEFRVPAEVVDRADKLASRAGGTLFTVLLAATQVLFSRYGRQRDIPLATVATGRTLDEPDGRFTNVIVLRSTVRPDDPFTRLIEKNAQLVTDAVANADLPFSRLVDALTPHGTDGGSPPTQVLVVLRDADVIEAPQPFELTIDCRLTGTGELAGSLAYDPGSFEVATIQRLARHLVVLLTAAVRDPARPVGDLPLLDEAERHTLLDEWGVHHMDLRAWPCVHELVGTRARLEPDAVAVVAGTETMTYGKLDATANQLAHLLVSAGVRRGEVIAVCLPRGPGLVTALLAVLRAGCVYLPLDPGYPAERLSFMLADADVSVCLTESALVGKVREATDADVLSIDEQGQNLAAQPTAPPAIPVSGRDGAYLIYTSGSTGRPKGTVIEHRSITALLCDADYIPLRPDDVVAQGADATFDAATFEIWAPLAAGARMVVIDKDTMLDPRALIGALTRHRITTLVLTTAVFNQVVAAQPDAFRTLRHLLFGGEAVNPDRVAQVLTAGPPQRLIHSYGPTETTTVSTWHLVERVDEHRTVPIGRPVVNTSVHVLDERLNPVPMGVVGELFIGGPGVARGYLARPGLTAERFLPDVFGTAPGDRLYRTGDLVRWSPEGALEYVGRIDRQVKVRGFRIEPNEIELVLQQHPDVEVAVVIARDDGEHKRLVGYVRPGPGRWPEPAALRDFVGDRLPEFMVPAVVVLLAEFPLTPSGKVDRAALPAPERTADTEDYVAPRTHDESVLADIWADVLDIDRVGVTDNFYELGGDSILGIKVVAKARAAGVPISAKALFRLQTIAALSDEAAADTAPVD
ncbi:non-ribosomal peptide synthetase [Streptomyces botrytidirepellens]|uniref:Amino acid adenylation domain-containing protein n=1 Tax=Streptomyces botrytidirepellens TaxID=2486417 RepID=A0A3M8S9E7_9ACTN|nr:non-ribosomal peptide synthetase [Streptomyces botrytidirepellens]RNF77721.1 amino acid adenylation domain-containing protein [Streptomyces botrytidirepellens]